jgi:dephospho-CoA kinase
MLRVAITGGLACGKSLVGSLFAADGVPVCDSDDLAHRAIQRENAAYRGILSAFGKSILGRDGQIVRARLGKIVFEDPDRLKLLNGIVHPRVKRLWESWLRGQRGHAAAAVMIPLLYETGWESNWDTVVCVSASEGDQRARLRSRGLTAREIKLRLAAQMPVCEKMERADHVIYNCGSLELLREQTLRVLNALLESKHA